MSEQRNKLLQSISTAEAIFQSESDWEYKFERIFGMSGDIKQLMDELGLSFDYYDPDTTYEEDVTAYVEALRKVKGNLVAERPEFPYSSEEMCSRYHDGLVTFEDTVDAVFLDVIGGQLGREEFVELVCRLAGKHGKLDVGFGQKPGSWGLVADDVVK